MIKSIMCYLIAREVNTPNCIIYPFYFANIRFSFYLNPVVTLWRLQKLTLCICTSLQTNCSWLKISNCKYKYIKTSLKFVSLYGILIHHLYKMNKFAHFDFQRLAKNIKQTQKIYSHEFYLYRMTSITGSYPFTW